MTGPVPTMVVDTSALVAIATREIGYEQLAQAIYANACLFPEPVKLEFMVVMIGSKNVAFGTAQTLLADLTNGTGMSAPFDDAASKVAIAAIARHAKGHGGALNICDLMVYGTAKVAALPILCTGDDFRRTDAMIHPASRVG